MEADLAKKKSFKNSQILNNKIINKMPERQKESTYERLHRAGTAKQRTIRETDGPK